MLDGNELAGDSDFFSIGAFDVSPDGTKLAYSTDLAGDEPIVTVASGYMLRVVDGETDIESFVDPERCRRIVGGIDIEE